MGVPLTDEVLCNLRAIVDYLKDSEKKHYEECDAEDRKTHIYRNVRIVVEWLNSDDEIKKKSRKFKVGDKVLSKVNSLAYDVVYEIIKVYKTTVWVSWEIDGHKNIAKGVRPAILEFIKR